MAVVPGSVSQGLGKETPLWPRAAEQICNRCMPQICRCFPRPHLIGVHGTQKGRHELTVPPKGWSRWDDWNGEKLGGFRNLWLEDEGCRVINAARCSGCLTEKAFKVRAAQEALTLNTTCLESGFFSSLFIAVMQGFSVSRTQGAIKSAFGQLV